MHPLLKLFFRDDPRVPASLPAQSRAIEIARVLCILGMVYAHAWTGRTTAYVIQHSETGQGMFRWFVVEMIGRSSVPLLGMVSGWLVASSALKRSYWTFVRGKLRTVLAPMIIWNILCVVLVCGAVYLGLIRGILPRDWWWVAREVTAWDGFNEINVQMPFLRDLFVCMVLAPLFIRLRNGWLIALTLTVLVWTVATWWFPLILRPQVALFFLTGVCARRWGWAGRIGQMPMLYAAMPFVLLAPIKFALSVWGFYFGREQIEIATGVEVAMRIAAALLMWRIALALVDRPIAATIMRIEPYAFLLFCSHEIMIWLFAQKIGEYSGPLDAPFYPVFFLAHPLLVLIGALALGRFLMAVAPWAADWLSGGRLRGERRDHVAAALAA